MVLTIVFSTSFRKCMNFVILFFSLVITLNFSYFLVFSYFGNFFIFYTLFRIVSHEESFPNGNSYGYLTELFLLHYAALHNF